jgi:hypothetical protein
VVGITALALALFKSEYKRRIQAALESGMITARDVFEVCTAMVGDIAKFIEGANKDGTREPSGTLRAALMHCYVSGVWLELLRSTSRSPRRQSLPNEGRRRSAGMRPVFEDEDDESDEPVGKSRGSHPSGGSSRREDSPPRDKDKKSGKDKKKSKKSKKKDSSSESSESDSSDGKPRVGARSAERKPVARPKSEPVSPREVVRFKENNYQFT